MHCVRNTMFRQVDLDLKSHKYLLIGIGVTILSQLDIIYYHDNGIGETITMG
jgi:hypothetical protein